MYMCMLSKQQQPRIDAPSHYGHLLCMQMQTHQLRDMGAGRPQQPVKQGAQRGQRGREWRQRRKHCGTPEHDPETLWLPKLARFPSTRKRRVGIRVG